MFDKFGEFDSWEEINRAAAAQKAEGDTEAVYLLAKENGIDEEDAEDYLNGESEELANPLTAAFGKLKVEAEQVEPYEIMEDWLEYIRMRCMESQEMALAVRSKKKSLKGCMAALLCWSFKNQSRWMQRFCPRQGLAEELPWASPVWGGPGRLLRIITWEIARKRKSRGIRRRRKTEGRRKGRREVDGSGGLPGTSPGWVCAFFGLYSVP